MDLNTLHKLRDAKFEEIRQLLKAKLGIDGQQLTDEAEEATERWDEDFEMSQRQPLQSPTALQRLLAEHYELGEQILDVQDRNLKLG